MFNTHTQHFPARCSHCINTGKYSQKRSVNICRLRDSTRKCQEKKHFQKQIVDINLGKRTHEHVW